MPDHCLHSALVEEENLESSITQSWHSSSFPRVFIGFLHVFWRRRFKFVSFAMCFMHLRLFYTIKIYLRTYVLTYFIVFLVLYHRQQKMKRKWQENATYRWGLHVCMCRMIGVECFLLCTTSMTCQGIVVYDIVRNSALSAKLCNKFMAHVYDCITVLKHITVKHVST